MRYKTAGQSKISITPKRTVVALLAVINCAHGSGDEGWSYKATHTWDKKWPDCAGSTQSPIDVGSVDWRIYKVYPDWKFVGFHHVHGVSFAGKYNLFVRLLTTIHHNVTVEGGGLKEKYCFDSIHFHWNDGNALDRMRGSEHSINGKRFPMEAHMVYFKCRHGSIQKTMESGEKDGLAVLGYFVTTPGKAELRNPGYLVTHMKEMIIEATLDGFVRYNGSLTTPPCTENVVWTVFRKPIALPIEMINLWRQVLQSVTTHRTSVRPIQYRNNRHIATGRTKQTLQPETEDKDGKEKPEKSTDKKTDKESDKDND